MFVLGWGVDVEDVGVPEVVCEYIGRSIRRALQGESSCETIFGVRVGTVSGSEDDPQVSFELDWGRNSRFFTHFLCFLPPNLNFS